MYKISSRWATSLCTIHFSPPSTVSLFPRIFYSVMWFEMQSVFQTSRILAKLENFYIRPRKPLRLCFESRRHGKMRQPALARVTAKSYWNTVQLKWRGVLGSWHAISPQEGGCPAPCIKAGRYSKCLKKSINFFFFGEVFHVLLELNQTAKCH